jgi:hypothetical protein
MRALQAAWQPRVNSRTATDSFLSRFEVALIAIAALFTGAFYGWCLSPDPPDAEARHVAHKYFAWQAEGWLAGRLDLPRTVPAGLLALPDPYDPEANKAFRLGGTEGVHDLSLYRGKLHLYWGPVPTLVAFLPWRVLTGRMLPSAWASWAFAFGAWLVCAVLLARTARKHFPATKPAVLVAGFIALAACSWAPVVLRRASVWETPIFAACFFGALTWWLLAECNWAERSRQWRWLALASLAWGFAVGSRPIWILGSAVLLVPLWLARSRWREREFRALVLAAAVPVGLCVFGLLLLNFARFDHALEFGQHWQLAGERVQNARLFTPGYAPFNVRSYLFSVSRAVAYFPFVLPPTSMTPPKGHFGTELTYGLLITLPWLWLMVRAPRGANTAAVVAPLVITAVALVAVLATFAGVTARYELEIALPLAMLATLGLLAWENTGGRTWLRRGAWLVALTFSIAMVAAVSCHFMGMYARSRPAEYEALARTANRLAVAIGWSPAEAVEAVELAVVFPSNPAPGRQEVLVASGTAPMINAVIAEYLSADDVRFIFFLSGHTAATQALRFSRTTSHLLRVEFGGMLPPATHPFWKHTPAAEIAQRRTRVRLAVNGVEFSSGAGPQAEPTDAFPELGALPADTAERSPFTGKIVSQRFVRSARP